MTFVGIVNDDTSVAELRLFHSPTRVFLDKTILAGDCTIMELVYDVRAEHDDTARVVWFIFPCCSESLVSIPGCPTRGWML